MSDKNLSLFNDVSSSDGKTYKHAMRKFAIG